MTVIGFTIQKGGTGKTTIAGNVAHYLSSQINTLLVDGDPQGSLSSWLLESSPGPELADVLEGKATLSESAVKIKEGLSLVPSFGIGGALRFYAEGSLEREPFVFEDLNGEAEKAGFDLVIYDLAPGNGRLERCILLACEDSYTPLTPEYFGIDGLEVFEDFLKGIEKGFKRRIRHSSVILNMVNRSFRRHVLLQEKIRRFDYRIFEIPQDSKLAESQTFHQSIFEYFPSSKSIPAIAEIGEAVLRSA